MISVAKLPPKKGYVEKVNPNTGEHYYVKNNFQISGYIRREIIVDSNRSITLPLAKDYKYKITLIGGGGSKNSLGNGSNAEYVKAIVNLCVGEKYDIIIGNAGANGHAGEPTVFGSVLISNGGFDELKSSNGLTVNGITYGLGETLDHPATRGICIIEYDEPIYE